jgi:polar amino acid transport system substrate-binding protein
VTPTTDFPDLGAIARDLAPTGTLRASINLGNPVLAQGSADVPRGVTVDLAHAVAGRLGLPVSFVCFDAAKASFEALVSGDADVGFMAIEPARAAEVSFTAPYVLIEGVYAVPTDSLLGSLSDIDRDGVRIGVKEGSAYDLYLTRTLQHASIVRGSDGIAVFTEQGLEVGAGIRQPVSAHVAAHPELRLVEPAFMQIRQSVATTRHRAAATISFLHDLVEELKANGAVADALTRSGHGDATVAPPVAHG